MPQNQISQGSSDDVIAKSSARRARLQRDEAGSCVYELGPDEDFGGDSRGGGRCVAMARKPAFQLMCIIKSVTNP